MDKILIICGPTATGKTRFALNVAQKLGGELISADSRQVYRGKNLIYGKDLPPGASPRLSHLKWRGRSLPYYELAGIKVWLYDVVAPGEPFSVAFWRECADLVITDILAHSRLPIVVGGSGLYLKSLTQSLPQIAVPPNSQIRAYLATKDTSGLYDYLARISPSRAAILNRSDRANPRRLIRAIEIAQSTAPIQTSQLATYNFMQIGLTAPRAGLYQHINQRIHDRIAAGAVTEDPALAADPARWQAYEHKLARRQITWFKKQPDITWFDIAESSWSSRALVHIQSWYNKP